AVDQQLVGRRHHGVGDLRARQGHTRDRAPDVDDRRAADEQPYRRDVVGEEHARHGHRDYQDQSEFAHAHCSWRTTSCARLSPRMISTVGNSGGAATTGADGDADATRLRATAVRVGAPNPNRAAGRIPWVSGIVLSSGLRSASWILPSVLASVSRSASSGATSSVTTLTASGLPLSVSRSILVPAASTCTLVRMTFDVMSVFCPVGLTVARTSPRVAGST